MSLLTIKVSHELLLSLLVTGGSIKSTVVTKGLPEDAVLIEADLCLNNDLALVFETQQVASDKQIAIEVETK